MFQKGAFSTAYQIVVGLCAVSTEASEVVGDKVHVSAVRKVKMSALINLVHDSEVLAPASGPRSEWYRNCKVIKFGHPLPNKEPTPDQQMAMHTRVVELKLEPYADFSILAARETSDTGAGSHKQTARTSRWRCQARVVHDVGGVLCGLGCDHAHTPLPARQGGRSAGACCEHLHVWHALSRKKRSAK